MTPEQKELKVEAFRALLDNPYATAEVQSVFSPNSMQKVDVGDIRFDEWFDNNLLIRLAPPAEIPESEEARARRLFADLKAPEGYGEPEFLGIGPVEIQEGYYYATLIHHRSDSQWCFSPNLNGLSEGGFYARARKLPTEKEKAEAALNAYKLEPGERLVMRGEGWKPRKKVNYLFFKSNENRVIRLDRELPLGGDVYYAEIIKEPEMVPFTQETFPLGAWVRVAGKEKHCRHLVLQVACDGVVLDGIGVLNYASLLERWEICTDGTTWTRAGKGVGA